MWRRAHLRRGLPAAMLTALLCTGHPLAAAPRPPSLEIVKATVDRSAHTVDLRLRICFSSGPHAVIEVSERRTLGGAVRASKDWVVPRGLRPTRISPFACRTGWRVNWLLKPGLRGPGTYKVAIRVRDAYGRWTPAVALSIASP